MAILVGNPAYSEGRNPERLDWELSSVWGVIGHLILLSLVFWLSQAISAVWRMINQPSDIPDEPGDPFTILGNFVHHWHVWLVVSVLLAVLGLYLLGKDVYALYATRHLDHLIAEGKVYKVSRQITKGFWERAADIGLDIGDESLAAVYERHIGLILGVIERDRQLEASGAELSDDDRKRYKQEKRESGAAVADAERQMQLVSA